MTPIILDSIIAVIILLSTIFAFFRGFVREVLTIINLAGGAAAAFYFAPHLQPTMDKWFGVTAKTAGKKASEAAEASAKIWGVVPPEIMSPFCSYLAVFFGVFIILTLAGLYVAGTIKAMGLGGVDKTLGGLFGALRGFLLVLLFYLPIAYAMDIKKYPDWAKNSISVAVLHKAYEAGKERYDTGDEDKTAVVRPVDPDSLEGKLKRLADDLTKREARQENEEAEETEESVADSHEPLTADEQSEMRP